MAFSQKRLAPFRLRVLLVILTAAAAGAWMAYASFMTAFKPQSEKAAGERLLAGVELGAAVLDGEVRGAVELARMTASGPVLRELLALHNRGSAGAEDTRALQRRLEDTRPASGVMLKLELAGRSGRIAASSGGLAPGADVSGTQEFRAALKGAYVGPPLPSAGGLEYEIAVPVPARRTDQPGPLGALLCRFRVLPGAQVALETLASRGGSLALAKTNGGQFALLSEDGKVREAGLKAPEAEPFLPALAASEGVYTGKAGVYAWQPVPAAGWVLAARGSNDEIHAAYASLSARARTLLLVWIAILAAGAFLAAGALTWGVAEAGRQAAALLEQCGKPQADPRELAEPEALGAAIAEVAAALRVQAARDMELETETEKLREEESDLKSQNDELEKLNKYLMERETKISELKQEISELKEKVGGGARA